jgi:asparagine synthase (glutamine-hydrolysing)
MCGFAGIVSRHSDLVGKTILDDMGDAIRHRGPDDHGIWVGSDSIIGLSHRRLAIVDLSAAGHQPMFSNSGRYCLAYNGEIYNHQDLRKVFSQRDMIQWRGHSDTETLLAGFDQIGVEKTLQSAVGMFAFALWDNQTRSLTLARDRLGEKPLYYGWQGDGNRRCFLFGSDLAALRSHPSFEGREEPSAVRDLIQFGYVPAPRSIYADIFKLGAGELLRMSLAEPEPKITKYWDAGDMFRRGATFDGSAAEAVDELERLASTAVRRQMMSDVPLGAFLSGGVDSSTIVALAQTQSSIPVKTFSIGFGDADHNEAIHAAAVAKHLGTDHHELYVTAELALDVVPKLPSIYSEPFADSSQIPVYLVSELARGSVTVALSGDGGDELFAGYNRYILAERYFRKMQALPAPVRQMLASAIGVVKPSQWATIQHFLGSKQSLAKLGEKIPKIQRALRAKDTSEMYRGFVSLNEDAASFLRPDLNSNSSEAPPGARVGSDGTFISEMMAQDLLAYLPDDILCKVDRAAMAVGLETRVPFLDHQLVEFAWSLPLSTNLQEGVGKWPLRQLLYRHVPKDLIERPKMGFSVPLDAWLRGPLKEWVETLVHSSEEDGLDSVAVQALWSRHRSGSADMGNALWPILMYRGWRERR